VLGLGIDASSHRARTRQRRDPADASVPIVSIHITVKQEALVFKPVPRWIGRFAEVALFVFIAGCFAAATLSFRQP
jgi:hypothetical protein